MFNDKYLVLKKFTLPNFSMMMSNRTGDRSGANSSSKTQRNE